MTDEEFRDRAILAALPGVIQTDALLYATMDPKGRGPWQDVFPEIVVEDVMNVVEAVMKARRER